MITEHTAKDGSAKLVERCTLPLTGRACVHRVLTDLAVLDIDYEHGFVLRETATGVTLGQVRAATDAPVTDGRHQ